MTLELSPSELCEIASELRNEAHRLRSSAAPGVMSVLARHAAVLEELATKVLSAEKAEVN